MNLLRVIPSLDPKVGGVTAAVNLTTTELLKLGFHIEIASSDTPESPWISGSGFVHPLGPQTLGWAYHCKWKPWLYRNIENFDVVLLEGMWQYPMHIAAQIAREKQVPYLCFPHGMLDPWFQKMSERGIWKPARNRLYWRLIEQKVINGSEAICFTCEQERLMASMTFKGYRPKREEVVGLGIPEPPGFIPSMRNRFESECPGLDGRPYILFLSRIDPKKGVDLLISAFQRIMSKDLRVKDEKRGHPCLVIAGPGWDTSYGQKCRSLINNHQASHFPNCSTPSILCVGMLSGEAKWGAFYGCEAFALPSHQENFGIAVVEAMACGKPVLISDQVNIWREIERSGAGLVEADTEAGIQTLLKRWMDVPKREMGAHARECYKRNFSIELAAKALSEVLRNL